jgi:hypothetical protein
MKSKEEIKKELHKLIDGIEDEHTLNILNDDVVPYVIENKSMPADEELSPEQELKLQEAIKQADEGKVITLDEFY